LTRQEALQKLKGDPFLFGKIALPTMMSVPTPPFHREIMDNLLDHTNRKLNIIAPRGHAKSSLVAALYVLYHLFFEKGPHFVVLVSKTEGHANRLLQTIKNALDFSLGLRSVVGYWGEHTARKWSNNEVILKNNDILITRGTGQQVIGLKHNDQRPTLVILDDPEDLTNTKTEESMEYNLRWLLSSLVPTVDALRGRVIVIGTPQHQLCIVETLREMSGWKTLKYSAIQEDGTALWPELWPLHRLTEERESLDSIGRISVFYREYMCEIVGDDEQLFRQEHIQYWDGTLNIGRTDEEHYISFKKIGDQTFDTPLKKAVFVFMGIDPASSTKQAADYSAIVPVAVDSEGNRYILPYFRDRVTPLGLAEKIIEFYEKYKPVKVRIESVGYQEMLREYLRAEAERRNMYIPGLEVKENPRTKKSARLESLQPYFYQKKVFLPSRGANSLMEELLVYPRGKHDDLLDAMYYAFKRNYVPWHSPDEVEAKQLDSSTDYDDIPPELVFDSEYDGMLA